MPGAALCDLPAFSQVSLDPGEIVVHGRGEEVLAGIGCNSIEFGATPVWPWSTSKKSRYPGGRRDS